MKKTFEFGATIRLLSTVLVTVLVFFNSKAQCPTGDLVFLTQTQVDNFINQYPNCTQLTGKVWIGEYNANSDITNLQGFQNITAFQSEVKIEFNDNLVDLTGLNNLTTVGGRLWIYSNAIMTSFNGLQNLTTVGGNAVLENNVSLTTLNGLNQLQSVGGFFQLRDSDQLTSLAGLDNLSSVNGLNIGYMEGLTSLAGIENLTNFGGFISLRSIPFLGSFAPIVDNLTSNTQLQIGGITNMTNLQGLSGITSIGSLALNYNENLTSLDGLETLTSGSISITENPVLNDISALSNFTNVTNLTIAGNDVLNSIAPLNNITTIQGDVRIMGNPLLTNLEGLNNLTSVVGNFNLGITGFEVIFSGNVIVGLLQYEENNLISDLSALSNLTSIGENLLITKNEVLTSLQGLNNLTTVGGQLNINNTIALTSLAGLESLNFVGSIELTDNHGLVNINSLNGVTGTTNEIVINNNAVLTSLNGLNNITNVNLNFEIINNSSLTNLNGLDQLNTIGASFIVNENENLTSFEGLNSLQTINGSLNVSYNNSLTDISNLQNIQGLSNFLRLQDNPLLDFCNYSFLCEYFANNIGAFFIVAGNSPNCVYVEIIEACDDSPLALDCPADVSIVLPEGTTSIAATWAAPVASNTCAQGGVTVNQTSGPLSGDVLTEGTYTVAYQASNDCNNTSTCSVNISILPTPVACNINVTSNAGVVTITGLTGEENAKLYTDNIYQVWACNPWNGPACTNNEVVTGLPDGTYFLSVQSYNCDEWITVNVSGGSGCIDNDGDGFCLEDDCDDNNDFIPTAPGTPCNDFNSNTTNDVIQADGCDCEGTPVSSECNVSAQTYNNGVNGFIDISGLEASFNVKLFNQDYSIAWECNPWNGNVCTPTYTYQVTGANDQFFLSVQSATCNEWIPITVQGDLECDDADNDGICDNLDCAPNDDTLPTTAGSPCDDFNNATENDVIQSDGCNCEGTPIGNGCNVNVDQTSPSQLTITGLTTSANTKLFDASGANIVWECNPWDAGNCTNNEVIDLPNAGNYFLAVQSENCNEWIPITVTAARNNASKAYTTNAKTKIQFSLNNLFPNPATDEVFMKIESEIEGPITIAFHDIVGKRIQQNQATLTSGVQTFQLDIHNLYPGIYNVIIQDNLGKMVVERFVKH